MPSRADSGIRSKDAFRLNLPSHDVEASIAWVQYLASQVMQLDRELKEEDKRFHHFVKWCLFGEDCPDPQQRPNAHYATLQRYQKTQRRPMQTTRRRCNPRMTSSLSATIWTQDSTTASSSASS